MEKPVSFRRKFIGIVEDTAKILQFIVAALAIAGLLAVYFPAARRWWERRVMPESWYQVGVLRGQFPYAAKNPQSQPPYVKFLEGSYDYPAWNGSRTDLNSLADMVGHYVLTTGPAVGRAQADINAEASTVIDKNACLYVRNIALAAYTPGGPGLSDTPAPNATNMAALSGDTLSAKLYQLARATNLRSEHPGCRVLKSEEAENINAFYKKNGVTSLLKPVQPKLPLCPRYQIWVHAQKLAC